MAIAPISRSQVSCPSSVRTPGAEPVSTPAQGLSNLQGSQQSNPLRRLLEADGFDSPLSAKNASGLDAAVQELARLAQVLTKAAQLLGSEVGAGGQGVQGPQSLGSPSPSPNPSAGSAASGGAPTLGGAPAAPVAKDAGGAAKTGNTMTFTNDGSSPMTIQFTPNAGDKAVDSVTLEPGKTQTVEFPKGWSGNFRSASGDGAAATLGEVKFNGGGDQTYYDVSYIEGDNASMTIAPESGGKKSGTEENLLASAPESVKARNADGSVYGIKKTTTSNVQDQGVVDFYRKHVGADEGYVIPTDDASTLGTKDTHLVVRMKDLVQGTTGRV
ncbi:hypothetical protein ACN28E_26385 [Archangium lansingense]|uniref:hypothetical protein n=1 Tax=Archangium lansingense TaxID=2995310 RepID=UPI003B7C6700